jgi:hypothetical protein
MGFAHFTTGDSGVAGSIRRRTGEPMLEVARVVSQADSITLGGGGKSAAQSIRGPGTATPSPE